MQLADVKRDDKSTLESGRVYLNGIQALTRLLIMQRVRDAAAGLKTAGFVSGFQGSPLNNMAKRLGEGDDRVGGAQPPAAASHPLPARPERGAGSNGRVGLAASDARPARAL